MDTITRTSSNALFFVDVPRSVSLGPLGHAVPRFVTGRLRVATSLLPGRASQIRVHFFGNTNAAKDAAETGTDPVHGGEHVDINLVIWQGSPGDLNDGVHEFPFSLQIKTDILPSYNFLLTSMPFSQQFDSASATQAQRQTRKYELVASVVCENNLLVMSNEPCPIAVKQCYPRWLSQEDRVGRGATAGGEYNVNVTIPRFVFLEDGEINIQVTISDGAELVKNITAVRCYLVETAAFIIPTQHIPIPVPIGQLFRQKVLSQHPLTQSPLFSPSNPLKITLRLAESRADLATALLQLTHSLVFEFVYKTGTSVSGLNPMRGGPSMGSSGSGSRPSLGSSGSTQNSVIIDPLRTIQMIHEALDKRNRSEDTASSSSTQVPSKQSQRLKASLIVPVRIVHAVPMDDIDLVNSFGGMVAPAPLPSRPVDSGVVLETPLTVRVGYEPGVDFVDEAGGKDVADQLRMVPGDQVIINDTFDDGWAVGTNLSTGTAGLFPTTIAKFTPTNAASSASQYGSIPRGGIIPSGIPMPLYGTSPMKPSGVVYEANGIDKEMEKQKLKEQMDQMQAMMAVLQAKLESL
ncbi:hypothetical protein HDU98_011107 [Podochytrium sp. JEL0797]|nr:hypothetical protein HDU98_011107 [Podochytrium sp. JEL0797]